METLDPKIILGLYDRPLISESDAKQIVLTVGRLFEESSAARAAARLSYAAQCYAQAYGRLVGPGMKKRKDDADELAKACRSVLKAAGIPVPSEKLRCSSDYVMAEKVKPSLRRGALFGYAALERGNGSEAVAQALRAVADLERWARQFSDWQARKKAAAPPGRRGRPANVALDKLFDDLEEIYRDEWDWIPTDPKQVASLVESQSPWPPPIASLVSSKEAVVGDDWREVWAAHGLNPSDFDTGSNEATGQGVRTSETVLQDTGAARPLGFFRLIWEVLFRLDERGVPIGELKPGAIEAAWRRRRDERAA